MNTNDWGALVSKLRSVSRIAWFPVTNSQSDGASWSKFGGLPLVSERQGWPTCGQCTLPMTLFLQLPSHLLPLDAGNSFGNGILQVFYCLNQNPCCESESEAYLPFSLATQVRLLDKAQSPYVASVPGKDVRIFPEQHIVAWEKAIDYPHFEDLEECGVDLTDEEVELLCEQGFPLGKDKLFGWPGWVQGAEYPECPTCGEKMKVIFQIDSCDHIPYMFGDAGCAYVSICMNHPDQLTMGWACS